MSKLERYSSYKDSGVEWLGEIPEDWELTRLGSRFIERKEKVSDKDFEPLSVTKSGVVPQLESAAKSNDGDNRKLVRSGDFVINSRSDRKGSSGVSFLDGSVSLINIVLDPINIDTSFCNYLLKSNGFIEEFYRNGHGIVADLWTTRYWDMKSIMLGIPQKQEQIQIASFLDKKTAQIEEVISQKQKLIELLKERRQIVINDAVTKGLDKGVEFVNSGVEWIGEIPKHWKIIKSKRLFMARKEKARKGDDQLTASQKHGVIYQKDYMELEGRKVTQVETNYEILKRVEPNDFLISMRSFQGGIEYCRYEGSVSSAYVALIPIKHVVSEYFKYLFKSYVYIKALASTSNLVRDGQALRFDNFSLVDLMIIPEKEQESIAKYLDVQIPKIDKAIEIQQNYISKLKEYKATLIDSVVTGKVRVVCD